MRHLRSCGLVSVLVHLFVPALLGVALAARVEAAEHEGESATATALPKIQVSESESDPDEGAYSASTVTLGNLAGSPREIPNSVSVVTRQRIEDQNFVTLEDAMQFTTAMKVTSYGTNTSAVESRGYTIDRYQVDGVSSSSRVYENNFGLAVYERVEVWRGPAGLMQGSGDPGGSINLVRKRALDTYAFSASAVGGSWSNFEGQADITGPLTADGRLRGRFVGAYQDRDYFTDYTWSRKPLAYGTLEYDVTDDTTLSVGSMWQRHEARPFYGIAAYADGTYPDVSRSTFLGADWTNASQRATRHFAEVEHRFSNGGRAKLTASLSDRKNHEERTWGDSFVDPDTGDVEIIPYYSTGTEKEVNVDGQLAQFADWRGLKQEFLVGANYQKFRSDSGYNGSTWGENGFLQDIFTPDVEVPRPEIAIDSPYRSAQIQSALYGQVRIRPLAPLALVAGARLSWFKTENLDARENDESINAKLVPYAGVVLDVSRDFSLYTSYSSIFSAQSDRDFEGGYLAPRKGNQVEAGVKGEHLDGRLNSSLALYRIEDVNRAMPDPVHPDFAIAAGEVRSQGAEGELTGRLAPQWNITGGYGYNTTKLTRAAPGQEGKAFNTVFPKHTFSLWTDYKFTNGWANGLGVGGGMRFRSAIFSEDAGIRWGQGSFSVFSLQGSYRLRANLKASLTVNNLFDKKYLDRPEAWTRQTYFGEPRSFLLGVRYGQ